MIRNKEKQAEKKNELLELYSRLKKKNVTVKELNRLEAEIMLLYIRLPGNKEIAARLREYCEPDNNYRLDQIETARIALGEPFLSIFPITREVKQEIYELSIEFNSTKLQMLTESGHREKFQEMQKLMGFSNYVNDGVLDARSQSYQTYRTCEKHSKDILDLILRSKSTSSSSQTQSSTERDESNRNLEIKLKRVQEMYKPKNAARSLKADFIVSNGKATLSNKNRTNDKKREVRIDVLTNLRYLVVKKRNQLEGKNELEVASNKSKYSGRMNTQNLSNYKLTGGFDINSKAKLSDHLAKTASIETLVENDRLNKTMPFGEGSRSRVEASVQDALKQSQKGSAREKSVSKLESHLKLLEKSQKTSVPSMNQESLPNEPSIVYVDNAVPEIHFDNKSQMNQKASEKKIAEKSSNLPMIQQNGILKSTSSKDKLNRSVDRQVPDKVSIQDAVKFEFPQDLTTTANASKSLEPSRVNRSKQNRSVLSQIRYGKPKTCSRMHGATSTSIYQTSSGAHPSNTTHLETLEDMHYMTQDFRRNRDVLKTQIGKLKEKASEEYEMLAYDPLSDKLNVYTEPLSMFQEEEKLPKGMQLYKKFLNDRDLLHKEMQNKLLNEKDLSVFQQNRYRQQMARALTRQTRETKGLTTKLKEVIRMNNAR